VAGHALEDIMVNLVFDVDKVVMDFLKHSR